MIELILGFLVWYFAVIAAAVGIRVVATFLAQRKEVPYAPHHALKAAAAQCTAPSGIDRAGRVSERDGRRGPGGGRRLTLLPGGRPLDGGADAKHLSSRRGDDAWT